MKNPVISIIAPIYGVEKFIAKFADSVLSQSYPHIQFIFVNDGTKDSSIDILKSIIEAKYSHLKERIVIVNKENGGLPAARKTGLEYVTGDYVYHVDSDDWLSENSLEAIANTAAESDADIIYFNFIKEYEKRSSLKREREYTIGQKCNYISNMYNHVSYGSVWNKCVKSSLYKEYTIHYPKYSYAEDCYVTTQLVSYAQSIKYLDFFVYHYRKDNPSAITKQARKKRKLEYALNFIDLYEKYRDIPKDNNPISVLFDDILIQAGWYSIFYGLDLFDQYPYLAQGISDAKINTKGKSDVPLLAQIFTKLIARTKR